MQGPLARLAVLYTQEHRGFRNAVFTASLAVAFLLMASIFAPGRTQATRDSGYTEGIYSSAVLEHSALGQIEGDHFIIKFYATPSGPLYSIYDPTGAPIAEMLTAQDLDERYPEVGLTGTYAGVPLEIMGTDR